MFEKSNGTLNATNTTVCFYANFSGIADRCNENITLELFLMTDQINYHNNTATVLTNNCEKLKLIQLLLSKFFFHSRPFNQFKSRCCWSDSFFVHSYHYNNCGLHYSSMLSLTSRAKKK